MAENDIVIKFKKDNGNIFLESIEDNGETTPYTSEKPLLTVNENGSYSKVENPDLNDIITSSVEEEVRINKEDDNFDFSDVYNTTNEEVVGNPLIRREETKLPVVTPTAETSNELVVTPTAETSNELVVTPTAETSNAVVVPSTTEEVAAVSNQVIAEKTSTTEGQSNDCEQKFNKYNDEITNADCNTINKNWKKTYLAVHPDKNKHCGDASIKSFQLLTNKKEQCEQNINEQSVVEKDNKLLGDSIPLLEGGKKNRTKKSKKGGKKKTKRVRFIMTRKGRKNRKNKTRR